MNKYFNDKLIEVKNTLEYNLEMINDLKALKINNENDFIDMDVKYDLENIVHDLEFMQKELKNLRPYNES